MSWGVDIIVDHPDGYSSAVEVVDGHTYNLTPMWCKALPSLLADGTTSDLDGRTCGDIGEALALGCVDAILHRREYEHLDPENGWGDFAGFFEILTRLTTLCHEHPTGVLRWNG
jgi:hypothetical protein